MGKGRRCWRTGRSEAAHTVLVMLSDIDGSFGWTDIGFQAFEMDAGQERSMSHDRFAQIGFKGRRPQGLLAPLMWLGAAVATVAALTVGAVLAVFTAAAVAFIALCAGVLVFFAGLAMRARGAVTLRARRTDDVIEARKVGDTWVAYGWERPGP